MGKYNKGQCFTCNKKGWLTMTGTGAWVCEACARLIGIRR